MEVDFVRTIVSTLTGDPDCFEISKSNDDRGVLITVAIDQSNAGRVIGKQGDTAKAIRNLLRGLGMQNNAHYSLKIDPRPVL